MIIPDNFFVGYGYAIVIFSFLNYLFPRYSLDVYGIILGISFIIAGFIIDDKDKKRSTIKRT